MRTFTHIWILVLCWAATAGVQGQTGNWQSAFEEKVFGQWTDSSTHLLACMLAADVTMTDTTFARTYTELSAFCGQLTKKRKKFLSESQFLYYVFRQVRQRYLYHYQPYPLFTQLFQDSTYNCVSGTALYAWILEQLGFETEIREMNLHAYLRVRTVRSEYLIDATDPYNGFVSDDETLITRRELWYASNELMHGKPYNKAITLQNLAGLQYFNEAVKAFNRRSYEVCVQYLTKAERLHTGSSKVAYLRNLAQRQLPLVLATQASSHK